MIGSLTMHSAQVDLLEVDSDSSYPLTARVNAQT